MGQGATPGTLDSISGRVVSCFIADKEIGLMKKAGLVCSLGMLLLALGCGHPTQLTSMSVSPTSAGVVGFGNTAPTQFTVTGQFIHPTETRDISNQVTWTSSTPVVATVSNSGLVTPSGNYCGDTIITAKAGQSLTGGGDTSSQSEMTIAATFTLYVVATPGCPAPPTS
jgi:hypothetical protein